MMREWCSLFKSNFSMFDMGLKESYDSLVSSLEEKGIPPSVICQALISQGKGEGSADAVLWELIPGAEDSCVLSSTTGFNWRGLHEQ